MTLHPHPVPPVPDATAAAIEAAFPKGNPYIDLQAELGTLYSDAMFASLFQPKGRPVEVAPWRLVQAIANPLRVPSVVSGAIAQRRISASQPGEILRFVPHDIPDHIYDSLY
jgi:hypothetical protein